ncbi:MAG: hypothetical protein ACRDI3_00545 [Actinomycetota bacterium]
MLQREGQTTRPWTVLALLLWSALGFGGTLVSGNGANGPWVSAAGLPLSLVIMFGAWAGKRWAYTLMLAGTFFVIVIVFPATVFLEREEASTLVMPAISALGQLFLLLHPATRGYATLPGLSQVPVETSRATATNHSETQPLGVRRNTIIALALLLAAITIAGTLGVMRAWQLTSP